MQQHFADNTRSCKEMWNNSDYLCCNAHREEQKVVRERAREINKINAHNKYNIILYNNLNLMFDRSEKPSTSEYTKMQSVYFVNTHRMDLVHLWFDTI